MNQERFPEEFRTAAVGHIVERGHPSAEVSARPGVSTLSLYKQMLEQQLPLANARSSCPQPKNCHA